MTTTSEGPQALTKEQRVRITAEATSMSELLGTQADASYSLLLLYEQTVEALEAELAASERATLEEVDNRDKLEDQITAIYYALGGPNEWSNQHDLGVEALAFAHRLTEELEVARSSSLKDSERLDAEPNYWREKAKHLAAMMGMAGSWLCEPVSTKNIRDAKESCSVGIYVMREIIEAEQREVAASSQETMTNG